MKIEILATIWCRTVPPPKSIPLLRLETQSKLWKLSRSISRRQIGEDGEFSLSSYLLCIIGSEPVVMLIEELPWLVLDHLKTLQLILPDSKGLSSPILDPLDDRVVRLRNEVG